MFWFVQQPDNRSAGWKTNYVFIRPPRFYWGIICVWQLFCPVIYLYDRETFGCRWPQVWIDFCRFWCSSFFVLFSYPVVVLGNGSRMVILKMLSTGHSLYDTCVRTFDLCTDSQFATRWNRTKYDDDVLFYAIFVQILRMFCSLQTT